MQRLFGGAGRHKVTGSEEQRVRNVTVTAAVVHFCFLLKCRFEFLRLLFTGNSSLHAASVFMFLN